ncbi:MAG: MoxR family ATPase [Bacillota bacterium]|nr:MoxR family ATPase [Bacillota bacterium]
MNIKQAKNEIKNTVKAYLKKDAYGDYQIPVLHQRPLLLIGPPGIGKTQIMEQIARECQIGLVSYTITHHTRQSAVGLPFIEKEEFEGKEYSITEYTMSEIIASIYKKEKETGIKEGILFIDEINCVSETLAPTMLQFLQCKTFGNQKVPEGWIIVAAGNPPEYNKSVRDFDMVTIDRVRYMDIQANYYVWKEYALGKVHPMILSYLELKPSQFYKVENSIDGMQFVTARGWEDLGKLITLYEEMDIPITQETIQQFLHHEDVSEDVAAYYQVYKKYQDDYGILDILKGKVSTTLYQRVFQAPFDERVSLVNLLLDGLYKEFDTYFQQKKWVDTWYTFLKEYRSQIEDILYEELVNQYETDFFVQKRSQLLSKTQIHFHQSFLTELRKVHIPKEISGKEAFMLAKEPFDKEVEKLHVQEEICSQSLSHAFQFMEDAFQNGQEMVIFMTNLAMHETSALFLSEHENEKYEQYKQTLLIGTRRAQLLDELNH